MGGMLWFVVWFAMPSVCPAGRRSYLLLSVPRVRSNVGVVATPPSSPGDSSTPSPGVNISKALGRRTCEQTTDRWRWRTSDEIVDHDIVLRRVSALSDRPIVVSSRADHNKPARFRYHITLSMRSPITLLMCRNLPQSDNPEIRQ